MKAIAALLLVIGAIAGFAINWPVQPRAAVAEPARRAASSVPRAVSASLRAGASLPHVVSATRPMGSSSAPQTTVAHTDATTLIRNIERALVSVDADERQRALENELPALVAVDAKSAGALVQRAEPGLVRDVLRERVARLWTARDLNGAMDWVKTLDDAGERHLAAGDVAAELATSDPATALEVLDLFGIGRTDGTLEHIAQLWAEEHPQEALDYAQAQEPSSSRDQLLARIATVQAARDKVP